MAHESSVHRFDAQAAHGMTQPIDAELAADGIDELIDVISPRVYSRDDLDGPTGTVTFETPTAGNWSLELMPTWIKRIDPPRQPDVRVRGTSNAVLLACYGRIPWSATDATGDTSLLERWSSTMNF
jgi:hypothetical protein